MSILFESYVGDAQNQRRNEGIYQTNWSSQVFKPSASHTLSSIKVFARRSTMSFTLGTITVRVRAATATGLPTGSDLSTGTLVTTGITTNYAYFEATMSSLLLQANTLYVIILSESGGDNIFEWGGDHWGDGQGGVGSGYPGSPTNNGGLAQSSDSGSSWSLYSFDGDNPVDMRFYEYSGTLVYPTRALTRVTSLIHRYNRLQGIYNLEIGLGEVVSDYGLPQPSFLSESASLLKKEQEQAQSIQDKADAELAKQRQAEELAKERREAVTEWLRQQAEAQGKVVPPPAREIPSVTMGRHVLTPSGYKAVPDVRGTIERLNVLTEEARARTRQRMRLAGTSPEMENLLDLQRRIAELQAKKKSWWEFWK